MRSLYSTNLYSKFLPTRKVVVKMRPNVMLLFGILLTFAWFDVVRPQQIWWDRLPNEKLEGVPRFILDNEKYVPALKDRILKIIGRSDTDSRIKEAVKHQKTQKPINETVNFFCDVTNGRSKKRPTSVHELRPGDIDVIAALGDSITAGIGAFSANRQHILNENRDVSFTIGGKGNWRKFLTLPNILKEFNPKLIGYSTAESFAHHKESQFNVAEPGALVQDLPFMVKELIKRIKKDHRIDFENDWKLVNLLIGANNICVDFCYASNLTATAEEHRHFLTRAFTYLRDNMPRTMVNFIHTPNVQKIITNCNNLPFFCEMLHLYSCPCLFGRRFESKHQQFYETMRQWQRVDGEVARDEQFRWKEDFAIVLQTFTKEITIPKKKDEAGRIYCDFTYAAEDCFHLSQKGQAAGANALWNNMFEPEGYKSPDWSAAEFLNLLCPTEKSPYIYTWKNSRL